MQAGIEKRREGLFTGMRYWNIFGMVGISEEEERLFNRISNLIPLFKTIPPTNSAFFETSRNRNE